MHQQKIAKKLPKRVSRKSKEATRKASWLRGEEKKKRNKLKQFSQEVANNARREMGIPTPWEEAKAKRAAR